MGKSLESTQNSTLNQFRHAAMSNQHDKLSEYLEISKEKRKEYLEKQKNVSNEPMVKGFTLTKLKEIEETIEQRNIQRVKMSEESLKNKNRHSMINSALDVFGVHDMFNDASLKPLIKQEFELLESETIKVSMIVGRCLSRSIKLLINVSTLKTYYEKSETFDIDGAVTTNQKWVEETTKVMAKYGDTLVFRRSLLPQLTKIIETFQIDDSNERVLTEDIWSFDF